MKNKERIPFKEGKMAELLGLMANDHEFRARLQQNPKDVLTEFVANVDDIPDECGELPTPDEVKEKTDEILQEEEENGFVGHWPYIWR